MVLEEVKDFSTTLEERKTIRGVQIGSPHFHFVDLSGTRGRFANYHILDAHACHSKP